MPAFCRCPCHAALTADANEARHKGLSLGLLYFTDEPAYGIPPLVDISFWLETLVAQGCSCHTYHVSLKAPHPKFLPPKKWEPDASGDMD